MTTKNKKEICIANLFLIKFTAKYIEKEIKTIKEYRNLRRVLLGEKQPRPPPGGGGAFVLKRQAYSA